MNNKEGKIYFGLALDTKELHADAQRAISSFSGIGNSAVAEGTRIDDVFRKAATGIGVSLAGISVGGFVQKMFSIRSEFQDTESSMTVFLGSADKAAKFMKELQDYAWYNMFEFSDLTSESAKLLAFKTDVEDIIPTLDKLSNIAAGTKKPLSDLVDLYNKAKSIGKVDALGLQSWANNGVVIIDVLKDMGVQVDRSAVKFEHLEMALSQLTSEGGMFAGLMESQMQNLSASYGQLQDDIALMFNELGTKHQDTMKQGIEFASVMVDNYEKIGKTLLEIAATYGVYRAAIMATTAVQQTVTNVRYATEIAELSKLLPLKEQSAHADIQAAVASGKLTQAKAEGLIAVRAEVAAKLDSLKVTAATAKAELLVAQTAHKAALQRALSSKAMVAQKVEELALAKASGNAAKIERAEKLLLEAQEERHIAVKARKNTADTLSIARSKSAAASTAAETMALNINTAGKNANVAATNLLSIAKTKLATIAARLNAVLAANVFTIVAAAVAGLAYLTYKLVTADTAAEKAQKNLNAELEKAKEKKDALIGKTNELIGIVKDETQTVYAQTKAWKELQETLPEVFKGMSIEDFKKLSPDEIKTRINVATDNREFENANKMYEDAQKRVERLKESIDNMNNTPGDGRGRGTAVFMLTKQLEQAEEDLKATKRHIDEINDIKIEAEFNSKPAEEKLAYYNAELERLKEQRDELDKILATTEEINDEWAFDWEKRLNIGRLEFINQKIKETQGYVDDLSGNGEVAQTKNKSYWEKRKKDAEESRDALDVSEANSAEWHKYAKEIAKAQAEIDKYNNPKKSDATKIANERKKRLEDLRKEEETYAKERARQIRQSERDATQSRIDSMEEGFLKETEQIKLNYQKLIDQRDDLENGMVERLKEKTKKEWLVQNSEKDEADFYKSDASKVAAKDLGEAEVRIIKTYTDIANDYKKNSDEELLKHLLDKYRTYEQQRIAINKQFDEEEAAIKKSDASQADKNDALSILVKRRKAAIKEINEAEIAETQKTSSVLVNLFADMSQKSVAEMYDILKAAEELYDYISNTPEADMSSMLGISAETLLAIKQSPEQLKAMQEAIRKLREEAERSDTALNKMANGFKKVANSGNDVKQLNEGLSLISEGFSSVTVLGGMFADTLRNIGGEGSSLAAVADGLNQVMDVANATMQGAQAGAAFGTIGAAVGAGLGLASSLSKILATSHDARKEKEVKRLQGNIDALTKSYEALERAIDKAYSKDAVKLIEQSNKNLEAQKRNIQAQIRAEDGKKNADSDRVKAWRKELEDIDLQIAQNKERAETAIFGEDIKSAIDSFATAYTDAWAAGEDRAKAMKDVVKGMIKKVITELLKSDLGTTIEKVRTQIKDALIDGIITDTEQLAIDQIVEDAVKEADKKYAWADKYLKDDVARQALQKGFASMNQESANELNGRFTALQALVFDILAGLRILMANSQKVLEVLSQIEENTKGCLKLGEISEDVKSVKRGVDDMNLKGLFLKKQ
jgi:hypothetical protein